jgi:hypothetical protein
LILLEKERTAQGFKKEKNPGQKNLERNISSNMKEIMLDSPRILQGYLRE